MPGNPRLSAEEFLSAVLDAVGALVVVLDRDGRIVRWNRACEEATGYTFQEIGGAIFWERLLLPDEVEGVKAVFRELRSGMFPNTHENHWVGKDGARHLISWSNTAVVDGRGGVRHVIATGIDVTRERDLALRVRIRDHLASLADLAAGITHEINNPLNAAQLQLTILRRRLAELSGPGREAAVEAAESLSNEIHRISSLAREFLEFSRPPALRRSRVDLSSVVQEVVWLCGAEAAAADVGLTFERGGGVEAHVDLNRMKQVILNLTRNAIEAVGRGGRVRLAVSLRDGEVILEVEDNGPGLPAPYEKVVEPFFTTKKHGTGLGLAVTHRIVSEHDGSIAVDTRPGRTLFTVRLPAEPDRARARAGKSGIVERG